MPYEAHAQSSVDRSFVIAYPVFTRRAACGGADQGAAADTTTAAQDTTTAAPADTTTAAPADTTTNAPAGDNTTAAPTVTTEAPKSNGCGGFAVLPMSVVAILGLGVIAVTKKIK